MDRQKRVVAIHDISCVGRCSLTVALPILSAAGLDTGILPTAVLSTHTGGFSGFTYRDLSSDIRPISQHWQSLGLEFDAIYSGFLGSYSQIDLVTEFFAAFKTEDNIILVDPVMGDHGELYSIYSEEMVKGMIRLCSKADIICPNMTEAAFMLGEEYRKGPYTEEYIETILKRLGELGAPTVVLTGVSFQPDSLGAAVYNTETDEISYVFAKYIEGVFHGTGDIFGSTLLAARMNGFSTRDALQIAVDYTLECIKKTVELQQERRYGVCFERAIPYLLKRLGLV